MRRALAMTLVMVSAAGSALIACGDDDATTSGDLDAGPKVEAGADTNAPTPPDASTGIDASKTADAADAADAGPTVTEALGATGYVRIYDGAVIGAFREDDTILRASNAPECVLHVASATKPSSEAGKLTIGGAIVGSDGGAPAPIEVMPTDYPTGWLYEYFDVVFAPDTELQLQLEGAGTGSVPAIPVQTLKTPLSEVVAVTKPVTPDGGSELVVPTTQGLELAWTPPVGASADQRLAIHTEDLVSASNAKRADLYCSYPLAAGKATIPVSLLAELKSRLGADALGILAFSAGDQKHVAVAGASYVIETTTFAGTADPLTVPIRIQ